MAGNPFRRPVFNEEDHPHGDIAPASVKTKKKKVTIQTPPRSPEDVPRRLSAGRISPPPPASFPTAEDDNDTDSTSTADLELEEASRNTRRNSGSLPPQPPMTFNNSTTKAPYNPFARTLATQEAASFGIEQHSAGEQPETERRDGDSQRRRDNGRATLNVDEFKNILLNGSAVPSPAVSTQWQSSSTDTSSVSRQSLFDPAWEKREETPRTSFDQMEMLESPSDSDDEKDSSFISGTDRWDDLAAAAPPKLSARGPQTVSFADFGASNFATTTAADGTASIATMPETAAGQKRAPPPPPAARRKGLERSRSQSNTNHNSESTREETASLPKSSETYTKPSIPPPPPSRKSRPLNQTATPSAETPPKVATPVPAGLDPKAARPPPPPRIASKTESTVIRPPSNASSSSTSRNEPSSSSLNAPPAPPPRRSGTLSNRTSVDGRPSSLNDRRRSSEYSNIAERSTSLPHLQNVAESAETPQNVSASAKQAESQDILADMSRFQAEIDALRGEAGNAG